MRTIGSILCVAIVAITIFVYGYKSQLRHILIIGDSISLGYTRLVQQELDGRAVVEHANSRISPRYPNMDVHNDHDSGEQAKNIVFYLSSRRYDIVLFNAGVWDMLVQTPGCESSAWVYAHTIPQYVKNLAVIVSGIRASGAKPVFVTTTAETNPPYCGITQQRVDAYNAAAIKVMHSLGVNIINLHGYMLPHNNSNHLEPGHPNVHYSDEGYMLLAKKIVESLGYSWDSSVVN